MLQLLFILFINLVWAEPVRVAFFKGYDEQGKEVRLTDDGEYFHTSIQIEGVWYEVETKEGVRRMASVTEHPYLKLRRVLEKNIGLSYKDIAPYMGLPFDTKYYWDDPESSYCTKLIANLLNVSPRPMSFEGENWENALHAPKGTLGLSPDELYKELLSLGFYPVSLFKVGKRKSLQCRAVL